MERWRNATICAGKTVYGKSVFYPEPDLNHSSNLKFEGLPQNMDNQKTWKMQTE